MTKTKPQHINILPCGCKYDTKRSKQVKCIKAAELWQKSIFSGKMKDRMEYWRHFDNSD